MAVSEVRGARYVPLFHDPIEWDSATTYEPLTIVMHDGASYTSMQAVPTGIDITNELYWACTGNYDAQIEYYRRIVQSYDNRIKTTETNATNAVTTASSAVATANTAVTTANNAVTTANAAHTAATTAQEAASSAATSASTAQTAATNAEASATTAATNAQSAVTTANAATTAVNALNGKFPITSEDIADNAVLLTDLATAALSAVSRGMTIRWFNSNDTNADNGNMSTAGSTTVSIKGFYIPEMTLLCVTEFNLPSGATLPTSETDATYDLPDYIPRPTSACPGGGMKATTYSGSTMITNYSAVHLNTAGGLCGTAALAGPTYSFGNYLVILSAYGVERTS